MSKNNTPSQAERTWAMISHVSTFLGLFIPLGQILAPLGVWLGQRKYSHFVEEHARESLNFQISVTLYSLVVTILFRESITQAFLLLVNLYVIYAVVAAAWHAHNGRDPRYQFSLRFLR